MATIDEDLGQIERDIRQLKIEYDQFFGGGRKRPPTEIEWRIDLLMKKYAERGGDLKSAQRFRFTNLNQTYAKYKDIFRKKVKQKEEGTVQRHFGAAAKAIEAERAQRALEEEPAGQGTAGVSNDMFGTGTRIGKSEQSLPGFDYGEAAGGRRDWQADAGRVCGICPEKNETPPTGKKLHRSRIHRGNRWRASET